MTRMQKPTRPLNRAHVANLQTGRHKHIQPKDSVDDRQSQMSRRQVFEAAVQYKGSRLANKFVLGLYSKTQKAQDDNLREDSQQYDSGDTDTEGALKQALLDGISKKVVNLSTKIKKMQMDVRHQLMDTRKTYDTAGSRDGQTPRKEKFGEGYARMLRNQKAALEEQKRRQQEEDARKGGYSRTKALLKTLEKRSKALVSGKVGYGSTANLLSSRVKSAHMSSRRKEEAAQYEYAKDSLRRRTLREGVKRQIGKLHFHSDGRPPFVLPAKELLHLVALELNFKDDRERASLSEHLESEENQELLTSTFWYIYLVLFDSRYPQHEATLLTRIAEQYMKMLDMYGRGRESAAATNAKFRPGQDYGPTSMARRKSGRSLVPHSQELFAIANNITRSHDSFFRYCPFVTAIGICYALHYLFPTSRHEYHHGLMLLVLEETFLIMTSIQFNKVSLERMLDCDGAGLMTKMAVVWPKKKVVEQSDNDLFLPPIHNMSAAAPSLPSPRGASSNPFRDLPERVAHAREARAKASKSPSMVATKSTLNLLDIDTSNAGMNSTTGPRQKKDALQRQPRQEFSPTAVSPAGRMYLQQRGHTKMEGKSNVLRRTVPDDRCRFGGIEALQRHDPHEAYHRQTRESQKVYHSYRFDETEFKNRGEQDKKRCQTVLKQLDGLKGLVLHRGTKYLRHFSLDMVTQQASKQHDSSDAVRHHDSDDEPELQSAALRLRLGVTHKIERLLHVGNAMGEAVGS